MHDPSSDVIGVSRLFNAHDARGAAAFDPRCEGLVRALASQAAVVIRNTSLEDPVFKDPLTGAYNRRYFTLRIAGDQVLREVTRVLIENSRNFSIVTRYGGDEFAVLLINTPTSGALRYTDRIKRLVDGHTVERVRLTASLGVASRPDDVRGASDLMPAADRALYAAKRLGR